MLSIDKLSWFSGKKYQNYDSLKLFKNSLINYPDTFPQRLQSYPRRRLNTTMGFALFSMRIN